MTPAEMRKEAEKLEKARLESIEYAEQAKRHVILHTECAAKFKELAQRWIEMAAAAEQQEAKHDAA